MDKDKLKKRVKAYWKENHKKYSIDAHSGTYLHTIGYWIHALSKITALYPDLSKKHKKKGYTLRKDLATQLREKLDLYQKLVKKHQNESGFVMHSHCDSTLYSGLLSVAVDNVHLYDARDHAGYWLRRNTELPCYPNGSRSSTSRDMMLGVYWWLWEHRQGAIAESTLIHAKNNNYVMGLGDPSRLLMMPGGEATLAEICYKLGGKNRWFTRNQIQSWSKKLQGYEVHLLVQHALLRGNIKGYISDNAFKALEHYASINPHNPLYTYAHSLYSGGDMNSTVELLLQENLWPSDRLPTSQDRSSDWVISRDYGHDWVPHPKKLENKEHPGADFIVVAHQILRDL